MAVIKDAAYWKDIEERSERYIARYHARLAQREEHEKQLGGANAAVATANLPPARSRSPASTRRGGFVSTASQTVSTPLASTAARPSSQTGNITPTTTAATKSVIPSQANSDSSMNPSFSSSLTRSTPQAHSPKYKAAINETARPKPFFDLPASVPTGPKLHKPRTTFPAAPSKIAPKDMEHKKRTREEEMEGPSYSSNSEAASVTQLDSMTSFRIPKKAYVDQKSTPAESSRRTDSESLPPWYIFTNTSIAPKHRTRDLEVKLQKIGNLILNLKRTSKPTPPALARAFNSIRDEIHELEFIVVNPYSLKKARLLDNDRGLPQIFKKEFSGGIDFPTYIQDDAKLLHTRWSNKIFEQDLFKSIDNMIRSKNRTGGPKIDEKFKQEWRYFGNHDLVNGQWWGNQLAAVRDGAHGSPQGGIAGIKGKGATSIVLSGDTYKDTDRDEGIQMWYSGTKNGKTKEGTWPSDPTDATQLLLDSEAQKTPVRVMRSAALPASNIYRPKKGFRFDGLYGVVSHRLIDPVSKHYVFNLRRLSGQAPIRYKGVEARPTQQQMDAYDKEMKKYGWKGGVP